MIRVYQDTSSPYFVLRLDYVEPVRNWDEYHTAVHQSYEAISTQPDDQRTYIIHNPGKTNMPIGNPFPHLKEAFQTVPHNMTAAYMIIQNGMARRMVEMTLRLNGISASASRYHFTHSLNAAYAKIDAYERETNANPQGS